MELNLETIKNLFGNDRYINLKDTVHEFVNFTNIDRKKIKELNSFLKRKASDKYLIEYVIMYHGTSAEFNIEEEGLKRTTVKSKRSIQSATGFVYLSLYPDAAKTFAEMGYPNKDVKIYAVKVPLFDLKMDKDQLKNKRLYGEMSIEEVQDTIGDSLIYGSGARVQRDIRNYEVRDVTDILYPKKTNTKKRKPKFR